MLIEYSGKEKILSVEADVKQMVGVSVSYSPDCFG